MKHCESHSYSGGAVCFFLPSGAQMDGNRGGNAHTHAYSYRQHDILQRKSQRNGGESLGSQARNIDAIHNIVEGLDQHRKHHGYGHAHQKL